MEFPINRELVESTTRIKEERRVVRERLVKIDDNRSAVSATVYARVRTDYETQLQAITTQLLAQKTAIDHELATLYEARTQVEQNVALHKEQLEELHFRHSLGEHDDAGFQEQAEGIGDKLAKFETLLAGLNSNVARYEALFADEPDLPPPTPPPAKDPGLITAPLPSHEDENTDDPEETPNEIPFSGDYFGPRSSETEILHTGQLDSDTAVGPPPTPHNGVLRLIRGGTGHEIFPLVDETTIGRSTSNVVVLREAKVSRQHAVIRRTADGWIIEDLQSSNGVLVNGQPNPDTILHDGDEIQIGDFVLKIDFA